MMPSATSRGSITTAHNTPYRKIISTAIRQDYIYHITVLFSDGGTSTLAASFSTHMPNQNLLITKMLTIAVGAGKLN